MMARSRSPLVVAMSGAFGGALACRRVGQSPARTPIDFARFTRAMPAAGSGASRPLSVGATASVRMGMPHGRPRSAKIVIHAHHDLRFRYHPAGSQA